MDQLISHPCIILWVVFNEAWGQYDGVSSVEVDSGLGGGLTVLRLHRR